MSPALSIHETTIEDLVPITVLALIDGDRIICLYMLQPTGPNITEVDVQPTNPYRGCAAVAFCGSLLGPPPRVRVMKQWYTLQSF